MVVQAQEQEHGLSTATVVARMDVTTLDTSEKVIMGWCARMDARKWAKVEVVAEDGGRHRNRNGAASAAIAIGMRAPREVRAMGSKSSPSLVSEDGGDRRWKRRCLCDTSGVVARECGCDGQRRQPATVGACHVRVDSPITWSLLCSGPRRQSSCPSRMSKAQSVR